MFHYKKNQEITHYLFKSLKKKTIQYCVERAICEGRRGLRLCSAILYGLRQP